MLTKQESLIWNLLGKLASCCAEECSIYLQNCQCKSFKTSYVQHNCWSSFVFHINWLLLLASKQIKRCFGEFSLLYYRTQRKRNRSNYNLNMAAEGTKKPIDRLFVWDLGAVYMTPFLIKKLKTFYVLVVHIHNNSVLGAWKPLKNGIQIARFWKPCCLHVNYKKR